MNKKIIEGLESIAQGINSIVEGLKQTECSCTACNTADSVHDEVTKKSDKVSAPAEKKIAPKKADKESDTTDGSAYTEEELSNMSYNDIKKLAKELGISAVGNRKEIVKKILSADTAESTGDEEEIKTAGTKSAKSAPKSFKKTKVEEPEPVEEDDEEDEDDSDETNIEDTVKEATADMSDDEIRTLLEDVGVSSKGKRQALISKLVKAVEDGLIDLDGDEDEDTDSDDSGESDDEESGDVTEGMTKARKKAYEQLVKETEEDFENGEISREDLIEFINAFNGTDDKFKKVSDEDLLMKYLELSAMLVSDDGEIVEEGAYTINEEPYCCGHPLSYDEDEEKFVCECCGNEYEAE